MIFHCNFQLFYIFIPVYTLIKTRLDLVLTIFLSVDLRPGPASRIPLERICIYYTFLVMNSLIIYVLSILAETDHFKSYIALFCHFENCWGLVCPNR